MWRREDKANKDCNAFALFLEDSLWGTFTTEEHAQKVGRVLATRNEDKWVGIEDDKGNLILEWEDEDVS